MTFNPEEDFGIHPPNQEDSNIGDVLLVLTPTVIIGGGFLTALIINNPEKAQKIFDATIQTLTG